MGILIKNCLPLTPVQWRWQDYANAPIAISQYNNFSSIIICERHKLTHLLIRHSLEEEEDLLIIEITRLLVQLYNYMKLV